VRNHDEKIKDMSKSVLPSTHRKGARDDRRAIHKRQRARELAAVTTYRLDPDPECATPDVRGTYGPDIMLLVWNRRAGDKLGPIIRWARATIAASPALRSASREEQVAYFARLMPDSTTGRHAVQHIEAALEWDARRAQGNASRPAVAGAGSRAARIEGQARLILEAGLYANLNARLRQLAGHQVVRPRATPMPHRPLLGRHDVEAFAAEMARWPAAQDLIAAIAAAG
jgi:hypothetical protein